MPFLWCFQLRSTTFTSPSVCHHPVFLFTDMSLTFSVTHLHLWEHKPCPEFIPLLPDTVCLFISAPYLSHTSSHHLSPWYLKSPFSSLCPGHHRQTRLIALRSPLVSRYLSTRVKSWLLVGITHAMFQAAVSQSLFHPIGEYQGTKQH